jgi:hypothetical protein
MCGANRLSFIDLLLDPKPATLPASRPRGRRG